MSASGYRGRFAPSPTGPLHAGSLAAALASWLDARAHGGVWLVRIEDVDAPRNAPGAAEDILRTLDACGMRSDEPVVLQSARGALYQAELDRLAAAGLAYPCGCSRKEIADSLANPAQRHGNLVYPGTCRGGLHGKPARAWRARLPSIEPGRPENLVAFTDRMQGAQRQDLAAEVGDFVLKRADGLWAYQLAVVADDAAQGVTDVVRGADLLDSTPRQIWLQRQLGHAQPRYLHVDVVLAADGSGDKLSKQTGAQGVDARWPLDALDAAAAHLGLAPAPRADGLQAWLEQAVAAWRTRLEAGPENKPA
ncbi:MAG: tRNA glutamyl-Q(34) synthetase GluQRS [Candidatus Protistobacter heckmanni]|nr:tRNA glutamyl-Q(34) synthetase GluQRS [Candidatus Protistobacter heckmanni]